MKIPHFIGYGGQLSNQLSSLKYISELATDSTVGMIQDYVTGTIANDTGILKDTSDQGVLFSHFACIYSVYDAAECFYWAAKVIKFGDTSKAGAKTRPDQFWIKCMLLMTLPPCSILI